jgi:hypothetical protein
MAVVDENGDLFGLVNVVDAVVVLLLVVGGVGAGVFVLTSTSAPTGTTHATLVLGQQPESVVTEIERGDTFTTEGGQKVVVTDVFVTPAVQNGWNVTARVAVTGEKRDDTIYFQGTPIDPGSGLSVVTEEYEVDGTIREVGSGEQLDTETTTVEVRARVSSSVAVDQVAGRTVTVGDRVLARVRNVTYQPFTDSRTRLLYYTVELETISSGGLSQYAGQTLREDETLVLDRFQPTISGRLMRIGSGSVIQRKTVVVEQVIDSEAITEYREGTTLDVAGQSSLRIVDRVLQPTSDPTRVRAYLTLSLRAVVEDGQLRFAGQPTRINTKLDAIDQDLLIAGQIKSVNGPPTATNRTVVIKTELSASRANALSSGDAMAFGNESVATIDDVAVYRTEAPDRRVAYVETTLTTLRRGGELRFGDIPVREGESIRLDTDEYVLDGQIVSVGTELNRTSTSVLLTDTLATDTVSQIAVGDTVVVGDETVATIRNLSVYGTGSVEEKRVAIGLELQTVGYSEIPRYGDMPIREDETLQVRFGQAKVDGVVRRVGSTVPRGTPAQQRVTLRIDDVSADVASAIEPGLVEQSHGTVFAELLTVSTEPETVVVVSQNGSVVVGDHPTLREVTVDADLRVRETATGLRFKREPLRLGENITLDLGTITVEATVVEV